MEPTVSGAKGQYGFKTGQHQQKYKALFVEQIYCSVLELVVLAKSSSSSKVMSTFVQMSIYSKQCTSGEKYAHIHYQFSVVRSAL